MAKKVEGIFTATNGIEYIVLEQTGSYALLKETLFGCYVVTYCLAEHEKGICWSNGHYYQKNLTQAVKCFNRKTK